MGRCFVVVLVALLQLSGLSLQSEPLLYVSQIQDGQDNPSRMKFPVDVLAGVSQAELERSAQSYMTKLLYSNPDSPEHLTLPDSTKVEINVSTVGLVPFYGSSDTQKVLALFAPADLFTPVALYLLDQWWTVSDILQTGDSKRDGAVQVEQVAERIVLYVLNRVVYRTKEMSADELPFLCHGETDYAKILWSGGEAAGFYSVKPTGSMCSSFSSRSFPLPVMDSMFVRKCFRGKGLGLRMLEDYVDSFREDSLGLRYPLTTAMYKVCACYLRAFPRDSELLWEVDSSRLSQRTTIASKIQTIKLRSVSKTLPYLDQSIRIHDGTTVNTVTEEINTTLEETQTIHQTVETVEEVSIVRARKGCEEVPVSTRGRSSGSKHRTTGQKHTEEQSHSVIRISEEVILPRFEQNPEVTRTEDMLNVPTENASGFTFTESKEEVLFQKVMCLQKSVKESVRLGPVADENTPHGLNTLCSTVIAVENVASEMEVSLHTPDYNKEDEVNHQMPEDTAPAQGQGKMERVLRTTIVDNIPLPPAVNEDEADMDKTLDKKEIPEETKNKARTTTEGHVEEAEETPTVHRRTLRGRQGAPTSTQPTRFHMRHKKADLELTEGTDEQEPALVQEQGTVDRAEGDVAAETEDPVEETQPEESTCAEAEDTKHPESSLGMKKESPPDIIIEEKEAEQSTEKEQEPDALPEEPEEPASPVETRALQSGPKIVTATPRCQSTTVRQDPQQETQDEPQEAAVEADPSKAVARKETSSEITANKEAPGEAITSEEEPSKAIAPENVELSSEGVVETRVLRSGAKRDEGASTQRTTRSRKKKAEEEIVETTAVKRGRKSIGRKQVSRSVKTTQEEGTCSAEEDTKDGLQMQSTTVEKAPIEGVEDPDVGLVILNISQSEGTNYSESSVDSKSQPESILEKTEEQPVKEKEHEPDGLPEEPAKSEETKALRSGLKNLTATPRHQRTTDRLDPQQETQVEPQDEPQDKPRDEPQDAVDTQSEAAVEVDPSKAVARKETSSEVLANKEAPAEAIVNDNNISEVVDDDQPQSETKAPEEAPSEAITSEEEPSKAIAPENVERSSKLVVETRVLRSGAKRDEGASTQRTTRSRKKKVEEETVETTAVKRGRKSTGRKQVSRTVKTTQEEGTCSAEEDTKDGPQLQSATVDQAPIEGVGVPDVGLVPLNMSQSEDTKHSESSVDSKSQPESILEKTEEQPVKEKEHEPDGLPEEPATSVETKSLRSGLKNLTATPRHQGTTDRLDPQQETQDESQDEPQDKPRDEPQDAVDTQSEAAVEVDPSKAVAGKETSSEVLANEETQAEAIAKNMSEAVDDDQHPSETMAPEESPSEAITSEEEPSEAMALEDVELSAEGLVETSILRNGSKQVEGTSTPRATRSRKENAEEETVETTAVKRGRNSTGRKQVSRTVKTTQEEGTSSAEEDTTDVSQATITEAEAQLQAALEKDKAGINKPVTDSETIVLTETEAKEVEIAEDPAAKSTQEEEPAPVREEDTVDRAEGDVAAEREGSVEETQPDDNTIAKAVDEEKGEEAACRADMGLVSLNMSQSDDTNPLESSVDMETQPQNILERKKEQPVKEKEHALDALPEEPGEPAPIVETRTLRSGPKTCTATPKCQTPTDRLHPQQETQDEPRDSVEAQSEAAVKVDTSKVVARKETSYQALANEEAPAEAIANEQNVSEAVDSEQLLSETKSPEEAPSQAIASEVELSAEGLVETRGLRSGAKQIEVASTPRTTRSIKKKAEEETVETTAVKTGRKLTGRKQISRTVKTSQVKGTSSAQKDIKDGPQVQLGTVEQAPIDQAEVLLPAAVEEDEAGMNEPVTDSETIVLTETKAEDLETAEDIAAKDTQEEEPAPVREENTVDRAEGDVAAETEDTVEETPPEQSTGAEAADEEKKEEAAWTANVGLMFLNTTEAEDTKHPERSVIIDKKCQPEIIIIMEDKEAYPGTTEENEPAPSVETWALRSGTKALTPTPRRKSTTDRQDPQQETQGGLHDAVEAQSEVAVEVELSIDLSIARNETSSEVLANEETPAEAIANEEEPSEAMATKEVELSAEGVVETTVLRSGARQVEGASTPRTTRSRKKKAKKETVETTAVKRGKKSAGRKQVSTPEETSQEEATSSAEEDATERPQTLPLMYDPAKTGPEGEQTPAKSEAHPTDNIKQGETGHQAAIEGASLPRVAVLLVDFNKVQFVTESPQPEQEESPDPIHMEPSSPNETPAPEVETRLLRSGGKPVASAAKRRLSQQQNEEECSTTEDTELEQQKGHHTEDQAQEAEQVEGEAEGTCESLHSKETQSSEQRTNTEEVEKSREEEQVAEETHALELAKGAEESEPEALPASNQKYVDLQKPKDQQTEDSTEVENTKSSNEEVEDVLQEGLPRVSTKVLRSGRKSAPQNADNRCTEDKEVPETSPPKRVRKSASATNRGKAKKTCIEPHENNEDEPSTHKDAQTEEIKPENTQEIVPEGAPDMGNTEEQEAASEAEEPHAQVELEKIPEEVQPQEDISPSQKEPALHGDKDGGKHVVAKRQCSQQQTEEECRTTGDTNLEEEYQAQETTRGLEIKTLVTEGSAEQEPSYGNMETEEADKAEDVFTENIQEEQPKEEEVLAQTRTYRSKHPTPRRSSRKRARVDYRDNDEELDSANASAQEDIQESDEKTAPQPQVTEEEPSVGDVLNLILDEEERSASHEEPVVIGEKVLRGRSVPSLLNTPHSRSSHRWSKGHSPEGSSGESTVQSPQSAYRSHLRKRRSVTPLRRSKRHMD